MNRLPEDAFSYYVSLGPERSYQDVAKKYGVSKRTVTRIAKNDGWQGRLESIERNARQNVDQKLAETIEQMNERHLKSVRVVQAKAIEALRALPIDDAAAAVRALDLGIRQERLIRGEPSERSAVQIEDVIRSEYERWMVTSDDEDEDDEDLEAAP